jgi:hypothetical protein
MSEACLYLSWGRWAYLLLDMKDLFWSSVLYANVRSACHFNDIPVRCYTLPSRETGAHVTRQVVPLCLVYTPVIKANIGLPKKNLAEPMCVCTLIHTLYICYSCFIILCVCVYKTGILFYSVVSVATCYGLDVPGIESRLKRNFPHPSRPARGTRWRSWLRHCATSRKVVGSIPDEATEVFYRINPSDRTTALGSTRPLTEMSTRNPSWG